MTRIAPEKPLAPIPAEDERKLAELRHHGADARPENVEFEGVQEQPPNDTAEPPPEPTAEPEFTQAETQSAILKAAQRLDMARVNLRLAHDRLAVARGDLGAAVQAWQEQTDGLTPQRRQELQTRAYLASEQARRAAGVRAPAPKTGNSVVDRQAAYGRGGDANQFARNRMRNGGYRHGAYPASAQGRQSKPRSAQ